MELTPEEGEKAEFKSEEKPRTQMRRCKRAVFILVAILAIGALTWGGITQTKLSNTRADLVATKTKLDTSQEELAIALDGLATTQNQLNQTKDELATTQNQLNIANSALQFYQNSGIGVSVFSGIQPYSFTDAEGQWITLTSNPAAQNPTWAQLRSFILSDKTDSNPYVHPSYTCADYARDVHNNAEAAGIETALVIVTFQGKFDAHALDAFMTTDQGLIFIDCSQPIGSIIPENNDTTVVLKHGEQYQRQYIIPQGVMDNPLGIVVAIAIYW